MDTSKSAPTKRFEFSDARSLQDCLIEANLSLAAAKSIAAIGGHSLLLKNVAEPPASRIGATKIGGNPDLPSGMDWPTRPPYPDADKPLGGIRRLLAKLPKTKHGAKECEYRQTPQPLNFIAQVNFSDLSKHFTDDMLLPKEGILYLFYDDLVQGWGFDPKDAIGFSVIYVEHPEALKITKKPAMIEDLPVYNELILDAELKFEAPNDEGIRFDALRLQSTDSEAYSQFVEDLTNWQFECGAGLGWGGEPAHKLGGWPNIVQNPMEEECALVSQGIYCGGPEGYTSKAAKEILSQPNDWVLLLQIDSDDDAQTMWGDAGILYIWIKHSDLEDSNFDNVWLILQCA